MFKILDGREEFYQWDLDRKLIVEDPSVDEVHFCNRTDDCSLVVQVYELDGKSVVDVPNILLQTDWPIRAYAYCGGCYTKQMATYKVRSRTKPADYVYTETEVLNYSTLLEQIEELEKKCVEIVNLTYDEIDKVFPEYAFYQGSRVEDGTVYEKAPFLVGTIETITDNGGYFIAPAQYQIGISHDDGSVYTRKITYGIGGTNFTDWERHSGGSVDLTDYVKTTDWATAEKAGVGKISTTYGIVVNTNGYFYPMQATEAEIDAKTHKYHIIAPSNLDYAVKSVGDGYYVKNTDYATASKAGVGKIGAANGISVNGNGQFYLCCASEKEIDAKSSATRPITPSNLDYAVKSVGDGYYATAAEVGDIEAALDSIIAIQNELIGG